MYTITGLLAIDLMFFKFNSPIWFSIANCLSSDSVLASFFTSISLYACTSPIIATPIVEYKSLNTASFSNSVLNSTSSLPVAVFILSSISAACFLPASINAPGVNVTSPNHLFTYSFNAGILSAVYIPPFSAICIALSVPICSNVSIIPLVIASISTLDAVLNLPLPFIALSHSTSNSIELSPWCPSESSNTSAIASMLNLPSLTAS